MPADVTPATEEALRLVAKLWSSYLSTRLTTYDAAQMMVLWSVARSCQEPTAEGPMADAALFASLAGCDL